MHTGELRYAGRPRRGRFEWIEDGPDARLQIAFLWVESPTAYNNQRPALLVSAEQLQSSSTSLAQLSEYQVRSAK